MENIVENVKGIMNSIHLSQSRIEKGNLSQKDQKNMIEMIGEAIDGIDSRKDLPDNDKIIQLKEHLGNIQDAFVSHNPSEIISEQKAVSRITDQLSQEIAKGSLIKGIFQKDMQIMDLENEKAELAQQLIDLDMQEQGEISDITRRVLEANHINLDAGDKEHGDNEQRRMAPEQQTERGEREAASMLVGTVYLSGTQTNKENFYGKDLEDVLNKIRMQQGKPDSAMAKAKTVYIKQQGTNGVSLKYDIASGKDITPIYLKLPFAGREEFKKLTIYLKENGAVFNPHKKEWYVTKEQDLSKFEAYLPTTASPMEQAAFQKAKERTDNGAGIQGTEQKLYGEDVYVDPDGFKEITQEVFDEIMTKRVNSLQKGSMEMEKLDFSGCRFRNVTFDKKELGLIKEFKFSKAEFLQCQFERIQFESSNFQGVRLSECNLSRSEFLNCDLSKAIIEQTGDYDSTFAWCNFSNTVFRNGVFMESVFGNPVFDGAVIDGTAFSDTTISEPSMSDVTFTMSGVSAGKAAEYAEKTKEVFRQYDKSLKTTHTPSNSIMRKLNENKTRAETLNKQNQPQEKHRETEAVK